MADQRQPSYHFAHALILPGGLEPGSKQSISLQQWSDLGMKQGDLTAPGLLNWRNSPLGTLLLNDQKLVRQGMGAAGSTDARNDFPFQVRCGFNVGGVGKIG